MINTKSDKQDARPNYKRGYGHHPLLAIVAETEAVLCAKLRPGNAGSNTAIDHVTVLADALDQLPSVWRVGHEVGAEPSEVAHRVLIRADAGGASHWFAEECVDRNLEFSFGFHIDHRVRDGVMMVPTGCWHPAIDRGGARHGVERLIGEHRRHRLANLVAQGSRRPGEPNLRLAVDWFDARDASTPVDALDQPRSAREQEHRRAIVGERCGDRHVRDLADVDSS